MSAAIQWQSTSPEQTREFGQALGDLLKPGDAVALCGPLGSGKTQLVKGIAAGLGVPANEPVVSPTFVLIREYAGRLILYHVDAYRLSSAAELFSLGLEELLADPRGVVVIEWADRVPEALPASRWWIEMSHVGEHTRQLAVHVPDEPRRRSLARKLEGLTIDG